jgi:hypothetical protein
VWRDGQTKSQNIWTFALNRTRSQAFMIWSTYVNYSVGHCSCTSQYVFSWYFCNLYPLAKIIQEILINKWSQSLFFCLFMMNDKRCGKEEMDEKIQMHLSHYKVHWKVGKWKFFAIPIPRKWLRKTTQISDVFRLAAGTTAYQMAF